MNTSAGRERRKSSYRRRPSGKLTIDTKSASEGKTLPYESRVQELSFVSFAESKARKNAFARQDGLKQQLEGQAAPNPTVQEANTGSASKKKKVGIKPARSLRAAIFSSPSEQKGFEASLAPPLHKRIKGLRPSPLDLSQDVSPSDRAITIGLDVTPSASSKGLHHAESRRPVSTSPMSADTEKFGQDVATPAIVITPAKDHFSPSDLATGYRPTSSIYSRYTNCMLKGNEKAPPVPPLPLFAATRSDESLSAGGIQVRESAITAFEEDSASPHLRETRLVSTWSADTLTPASRFSRPLTAGLPTPRRSKGWWNVITSPFSAKTSSGTFWRSLPAEQEDEKRMLDDVASVGTSDPHAGVIFLNRAPDDEELRSAPAEGPSESAGAGGLAHLRPLKRSDTAPGALDPNTSGVNIYEIPWAGEAAAYYNPNCRFPSICASPQAIEEASRGSLVGWSPSQSVYRPSRHSHQVVIEDPEHDGDQRDWSPRSAGSQENAREVSTALKDPRAPSTSSSLGAHGAVGAATPSSTVAAQNIFSTPSEDELRSAGLEMPSGSRNMQHTPAEQVWSPLSATPVVQNAHFGHVVGPHSSFGEQRQVEVEPTPHALIPSPAPTPSHYGLGFATLGAATIAHRSPSLPASSRSLSAAPQMMERSAMSPTHVRQDFHGLGISNSETELFPPPQHLREKPRLGTDKFGQLTIRTVEEYDKPRRPWYRRFFWLLAAAVTSLLLLMIILMVVFVPQKHTDMSVQATWVNLTGFPALSTGVSTVIQPRSTNAKSTCVSPWDMWSCAAPGKAKDTLPDFRFEIRCRNGTLPSNETAVVSSSSQRKRWQESSPLHAFVKRNGWSDYLYSASPAPPSDKDQNFLGRTTDNITTPYDGEETPFYISILDVSALKTSSASKLIRRDNDSNFTYPYPTTTTTRENTKGASTSAATSIPPPALKSNGEPATQQVYPFPTAQPLKLYNRGQETEHYGFYTYFDKSIYLSAHANASQNGTDDDFNNNVALNNASTVCTFSQTRFLVQIWTKRGIVSGTSPASSSSEGIIAASNSSANDMSAPGSFAYPVTITIDRHGGDADKKGVYCYGLNEEDHVVASEKMWIVEDREVGGKLVSPAEIPGANSTTSDEKKVRRADDGKDGYGGIDGGTGGCGCQWQNWE